MTRWLVLALSMAAVHAANPSPVVVLELFTSEGCAACLPAEQLALSFDAGSSVGQRGKAKARSASGTPVEVIVLGEHVDYFDSEAWRDPYSSPLFSARQQDYGVAMRRAVMYTPQMIVNGQFEVNDPDIRKISLAIREASRATRVSVSLALGKEDQLTLTVGRLPKGGGRADILLAVAESGLKVSVGGGENKGRVILHAPVVQTLTHLGEIDLQRPGEYSAQAKLNLNPQWIRTNLRLVLLVQDRTTRRILGAAQLRLQPADPR